MQTTWFLHPAGQYHGSGPFGKGMCQDFTLPHCHHHGPQGQDPYPAEGQPGCESQSSPMCRHKCDLGATNRTFDKYTYKGITQSASGVLQIQQMILEGGPVETVRTPPHPNLTRIDNVFSVVVLRTSGIYAPSSTP